MISKYILWAVYSVAMFSLAYHVVGLANRPKAGSANRPVSEATLALRERDMRDAARARIDGMLAEEHRKAIVSAAMPVVGVQVTERNAKVVQDIMDAARAERHRRAMLDSLRQAGKLPK